MSAISVHPDGCMCRWCKDDPGGVDLSEALRQPPEPDRPAGTDIARAKLEVLVIRWRDLSRPHAMGTPTFYAFTGCANELNAVLNGVESAPGEDDF